MPSLDDAHKEEENDEQPEDNTGGPATKWITVFNRPCHGTVQRCRYNVRGARLSPKIAKGKKDGLFISCVASCSNLWALIMNDATGFSDQVYKLSPNFLPHEWIEEQWNKDFHISAIAGADNGSSLVVMSKGTRFLRQHIVVSDSFPYEWIINQRKNGCYVTAMATSEKRWAIVASEGAGFSKQVVEVHSKYPSEHVRGRWDSGYDITATAANADRVALVLSVPRTTIPTYNKQETYRSSAFPERHVHEYWDKDFYVSSICYGRTFSLSVWRQAMVC
ncbi:hypothetical protein L484_001313 [Morus notabilis]|uniref:DUF7477 domain-containing protein n=1 Tax=Morus notabilis TaxID=981085 RepID=W9SNS2_9ROSA|nr:casein kinase 1-like protein HD16 [Morus notabilis]EXC36402.1 hypothetical protein L484_001313 [Morus notabilis]